MRGPLYGTNFIAKCMHWLYENYFISIYINKIVVMEMTMGKQLLRLQVDHPSGKLGLKTSFYAYWWNSLNSYSRAKSKMRKYLNHHTVCMACLQHKLHFFTFLHVFFFIWTWRRKPCLLWLPIFLLFCLFWLHKYTCESISMQYCMTYLWLFCSSC